MPKRSQETLQIIEEVSSSTSQSLQKGGEDEVAIYKDYTRVFTPSYIAKQMVELLELTGQQSILEPSAGLGNLIKAIHNKFPEQVVHYLELNETDSFRLFLHNNNVIEVGHDFIQSFFSIPKYDRIIANPPFDRDKWLQHIPKMYRCLAPSGVLVTLAPKQPLLEVNKSMYFTDFKDKMRELGAESYPVENWHTNKDGSKTDIHIIKIRKQ